MPRRNYKGQRRMQRSKRARQHLKEARWAGLPGWVAHPSHVSWRPNRNGNRIYKFKRFRHPYRKDY